jgi:hypothetical protein
VVGHAARTDSSNDCSFRDARASRYADRAKMKEGSRVAGGCLNRDRLAAGRHRARERHNTARRRNDRGSPGGAEIEPTMLAAGVRVRTVERERPEDRPVDGPRPRLGGRNGQSESNENNDSEPPHERLLVVNFENENDRSKAQVSCQYWLQSTTVELVARCAGQTRDDVGGTASR